MNSDRFPGVLIHPSAIVEEGVEIGPGSRVYVNVQIRREAKIGRDCILGKDVFVDAGVTIGNRVKVQNGVSIYHGVTVEDGVFLGPHCVLTNDLDPAAIRPDGALKTEADWQLGRTIFRYGARVGAGAIVVCGDPREIGRFALIGAGAVVTKDVPDFALVVGNPARFVRYVCPAGLDHQVDSLHDDEAARLYLHCLNCGKLLEEVMSYGDQDSCC